jgi:hypothetical protein
VPTPAKLDHARALREVRNLARRQYRRMAGSDEADLAPTAAEVRAAAGLLADLYRAGQAHGIAPEEWWITVDLAELAVDAIVHIRRTATPPPAWDRDGDRRRAVGNGPRPTPGPGRATPPRTVPAPPTGNGTAHRDGERRTAP